MDSLVGRSEACTATHRVQFESVCRSSLMNFNSQQTQSQLVTLVANKQRILSCVLMKGWGCGMLGEYKLPASRKSLRGRRGFQKFLWVPNIFFFSFRSRVCGVMLYRCWKPSDWLLWTQTDYSCCPLPASCALPRVSSYACWGSVFDAKHTGQLAEANHITHNNRIIHIGWRVVLLVGWGVMRRWRYFVFLLVQWSVLFDKNFLITDVLVCKRKWMFLSH